MAMDPKTFFLLCFLALACAVVLIVSRRYIRFRWNFGVWQGQRGAERLAREVMKSHAKRMAAAGVMREKAMAEFDKCPNLPALMAAKRKILKKAERKERVLRWRYEIRCSLLKEFMMGSEVKIADGEMEFERRELRRHQSKLTAVK
jgi:hypothetical protein